MTDETYKKPRAPDVVLARAAWYERLYEAYRDMPREERYEVVAWQQKHGHISTWPGWEPRIGKAPRNG